MSEFKRVAALNDIPPGTMKAFEVLHTRVLVCNINGSIYAIANECTHDSAPMSDGHLDGDQVVCPRHGARFDVKDGAAKAPPAVAPVDTYEVKIDGNDIFVLVE